jgi:hypothetical protein
MGTTTKMAIPYPEATGLVKDGWEDMKDIATQVDAKSGLVLLNTTNFTSQSSVSISSVFSANYKDYMIQVNAVGTTDNTFAMRLRSGSTDNSSNNYYSVGFYQTIASSAVTGQGYGGPTSYWWCGDVRNGLVNSNVIYVHQPFDTAYTTMNQQMLFGGSTTAGQICSTGSMSVNTSYDGFTLYPATGQITGSISTYGINR